MKKLYFIITLLLHVFVSESIAQTNISGTINTYAKITAISGTQFTIGTVGGRTGASSNDFIIGNLVLIYQAKGTTINTSNSSNFGDINNYGNAGNYEIATITANTGANITVDQLTKNYDVAGLVQLVNIPEYTHASNNATLSASTWSASAGIGGILILKAEKLTLAADINLDGKGFDGGDHSRKDGSSCKKIYHSNDTKYGEKGEGITSYSSNLRAMGELANGGGGGSTHNAGGGGGSNYGGGGQGGGGWRCSGSNFGGGNGAPPLNYGTNLPKLFFGGAGGGGQQNNNSNSEGGNGGGIIILLVGELTSDCSSDHSISAQGFPGLTGTQDGAGGAGAGGVIMLNTAIYNINGCQVILNANGGDGADVNHRAAHGGGGGGGAGLIVSNTDLPASVVSNASNGSNGGDSNTSSSSGNPGTDPPGPGIVDPVIPGIPYAYGPGGVKNKLNVWFRANASELFNSNNLTTPTSNGSTIRSWENPANSNTYLNSTSSATNTIFLNTGADLANNHGIVRMNNTDQKLKSKASLVSKTIIVVTKSSSTSHLDGLVGFANDRGIRLKLSDQSWTGDNNSGDWSNGGSAFINASAGEIHNNQWHIVSQIKGNANGSSNMYVGGYYTGRGYTGDITEIISYKDAITTIERHKIESYLAIKYGINLESNYVDSDNYLLWDYATNATYNNNITGLGRDDISELNQSKSQSIHSNNEIIIANGTNISSPSNLTNNQSFLIWGHNNEATNTYSLNFDDLTNNGIARIWKVAETGTVGTVRIQIDESQLPTNVNNLYISNSSGFTPGTGTRKVSLSKIGNKWEVNVDFSDGDFFSFGLHSESPQLSNIETNTLNYCSDALVITDKLTITDSESDDISATISISNNFIIGQDELIFPGSTDIIVANATAQTIQLNAASMTNMQTALRKIEFRNTATGASLNTNQRSISFTVNDSHSNSNTEIRVIDVHKKPNPQGIFHN